jgi:hypothetical protein
MEYEKKRPLAPEEVCIVWAVLFAHLAARAHSKIPAPHSSLPTRWISLSLSLSLSLQMPAASRLLFSPVFFFFFFLSVPTFSRLRLPLPYWSPHHFGEHHKGHGNLRSTRRRIRRSRAPAANAAVRQAPK